MSPPFLRSVGTCALATVLATSCRQRPRPPVVYDLVTRAAVAAVESEWTFERMGTIDSERRQERGFRRLSGPGADQAAAVTARSTFLLPMPAPAAPRRLLLDIQPESAGEELEVALDGAVLGLVPLKAGRQHLAFDVPAERQRTPRQRLRLRFPRIEEARGSRRAGPDVARVYSLTVGLADDPGMAAIARQGSRVVGGGEGVLMQAAPSRVRFALLRPESAELTMVPALPADAPAGAAVTVRVLARDAAGERELWSKRLQAGERPNEARISLPGATGEAFELVLAAEAPADRAAPFVAWGAPRVHGAAPVDPLQDDPSPAAVASPSPLPGVQGVLLVIFDAARARQFGCYGYGRNTTPEVDRLAREGVVFEDHITPAVFTTAAMSAVWTSQAPDAGQSEWLHAGKMPRERLTLAELLSAQGIETAGFIANPSAGPTVGLDRGFGLFEALYREPWHRGSPPNAEIFRVAVHPWIRKPHGRFLLYTHWREPHTPYGPVISGPDAPLPAAAKWYRWWDAINGGLKPVTEAEKDHLVRLYDGNLAWADRELGRLRGELEKAGLWDRMAVIVTGDHGEALFEHGYTGHNIQLFDELTHVPLVMRLPPAAGLAGRRVRALTSHLDIAPTVADILGVRGRGGSDRAFRGRSLLDVARGGAGARGVVARTVHARPTFALVTPRYKLIHDLPSGDEQLYDLAQDPAEQHDLAEAQPLLCAALRQSLHRWLLDLRTIRTAEAERAEPDATDTEALKALGYVQ